MQQKKETIETFCLQDHMTCRVAVELDEGRIKRIQPTEKKFPCLKCNRLQDTIYHPDRLKYPLKNVGKKDAPKWQRISWDEALDTMASKFGEIKEKYGGDNICSVIGSGHKYTPYGTGYLFSYVVDSPNTLDANQLCTMPVPLAMKGTVGKMGWVAFHDNSPDYPNSKCIMLWGSNPIETRPPHAAAIRTAKKTNGAKLIIVDPRPTRMTNEADLWLQPRPGSDGALTLAILNVIINEGLYDRDFVDRWCVGFDKLRERVQEYPPKQVAEITWVPEDKIVGAARMFATNRPGCVHPRLGVGALTINAYQASRAIIIMTAICGNFDVKGGNFLPPDYGGFDVRVKESAFDLSTETLEKRIGAREYPLLHDNSTPDFPSAVKGMLRGNVKGIYSVASNWVINEANTEKNIRALKNVEFSVCVDLFMTPTAELSDLVLPAAHFLETEIPVADYQPPYNRVLALRKVIEPIGECWDDRKIVLELAKRMNVELPWKSVEEFNDWRCEKLNIKFKELQNREGQMISFPVKYKRYEKKGFNTPSGKVELHSSLLEKHGYDPLPNYVEHPESPVSAPELYKEYPLIYTDHRVEEYVHTEGRQVASLRNRKPEPYLEINPETASNLGIRDGDWVALKRPNFERQIKFKAKLTPGLHSHVVSGVFGWWFPEKASPEHGCLESNINAIISDEGPYDPMEGTYQLRGVLCRVSKL